jgi:hypothetical protein
MCELSIKKAIPLIAAMAAIAWAAIPAHSQPVALGFRTPQFGTSLVPPSGTIQPPQSEVRPPAFLIIPAGAIVMVGLTDVLSTRDQQTGDTFLAELEHPLVADGWVVARRGQTVTGRVAASKRAGRVKGTSQLSLELNQIVLADGRQIPVQSELIENPGPTSHGRDAAIVAITTAAGAAIGAVCGAKGAAIGASTGAVAGIAGVLLTRGEDTSVGPERLLSFRLAAPISISTEEGRMAFWQIAPDDYAVPEEIPQPPGTPVAVVVTQPSPQLPAILLPELQTLTVGRPGRKECGN